MLNVRSMCVKKGCRRERESLVLRRENQVFAVAHVTGKEIERVGTFERTDESE